MIDIKQETKIITKHSSVYFLGGILSGAISFIMLPIYTQFLVPADYGIIQLLGLTTDVIGMVISMGISSAMYRFYFDYDTEKERNEVISTAMLSFGIIALVSLSGISLFSEILASKILDSTSYYHYFLISFSSMWFNTVLEMGYTNLRIRQKSIQYMVFSLVRLLVSLSFNIYLVVVVRMGVLGVLLSTLLTSIIFNIILTVPLLAKIGLRFSMVKCKQMLKFGAPLIPASLAAFTVHVSDRFFIKYFTGLADTGIYALGYRFGNLPNQFVAVPFMQIWEIRFLKFFKEKDASKIFGQLFTYLCLLLIFVGLTISSLIREVLMIVSNPSYWEASKIVPIIVIAYIIFSFHYFFSMSISFSKKTSYFSYINLSNGILNIILNILLIKPYGIWGAAYATLICMVYKVWLTYFIGNRMYRIDIEVLRILKMTLVALALYIICTKITFNSPFLALAVKTFIVSLFPFIIYFLKCFTPEEKKLVRTFFRTPRYAISQIFKKQDGKSVVTKIGY